jgi:hypothetical protein
MPRRGDCPGESVYDRGSVRVEGTGATEAAAFAAMRALLPGAKIAADNESGVAFRAALVVGDAACKPGVPPCDPCTAVFLVPPLTGPWEGAVSTPGLNPLWLARGGYKWKVIVDCQCPVVAVAGVEEEPMVAPPPEQGKA